MSGEADDKLLEETIDFPTILAALPRWIIRSRTPFGAFLAKTFHIRRTGSCPSSAVFPIPVPKIGVFNRQDGPKLSARRWHRLCRHRALHVIVMMLNYLHSGLQPVSMVLLGRSPTATHLAIYGRLRALITASERPDKVPLPPGRSGPEFLARLIELERFVEDHACFNADPYVGAEEAPVDVPKEAGRVRDEHRFRSSAAFSPIHPYRSLQPTRLKLSGDGSWPLEDFLEDILYLPYLEPDILKHGGEVKWQGPSFERENKEDNLLLAKIWDRHGLLALFAEEHGSGLSCRVFNAHKNASVDRQIGDRRWINGYELHPRGPSGNLPSGAALTSVHCPTRFRLVGCASDRKDFYHQARASRERAHSNLLPFCFEVDEFEGTKALDDFLASEVGPYDREIHGDRYHTSRKPLLAPKDVKHVYAGFKSLFQGDHLGVEYALASHSTLLRRAGLLRDESNVLRNRPFPRGPLWEALVIDDYVIVSKELAAQDICSARSLELLGTAEKTYEEHKVKGSDDKTVRGEECFKAIGAEFLSDKKARDAGVVLVGAPSSKRLPMIALSLKVAAMPVISRSLASRIAGNWVSIFMYRRPCCCALSSLFSFGTKAAEDGDEVLELPRRVADELVVASVLGLVAVSDISVHYDPVLYATDASMNKGAFTGLWIGEGAAELAWLGGDRKGCYTVLDAPAKQQLRILGEDVDYDPMIAEFAAPRRCLDFVFDAVEVCGGSGVLSEALSKKGLRVCTPIDLSRSKHYNLEDTRLIDWIFQMIHEKRFRSVICEPVCRTFSAAQHPSSRSYAQPLGFNRSDRKTYIGNLLAFRCLAIMWFCWRSSAIALLEQPLLSKMAWLPMWQYLLTIGFSEAHINSCAFGSIHKKPFRWLGYGLPMEEMHVPCPGGHHHVKIKGKYTKGSAIYHPGLAEFIAKKLFEALMSKEVAADVEAPKLESVFLNDLLSADGWRVLASWSWSKPAHINVLESRSLVELCKYLTLGGGDRRLNALLDSRVAKGAHAKGRSSSTMLRPSLLRSCAYMIAGNLHP